jgi:hypothetical protein
MLSKKGKILQLIIISSFVFMGARLRLIPHSPNFAPIAAIALFGGVYFSRKFALLLPVAAMLLSDIFIGFYQPILMAAVYGSFLLTGLLGLWLKTHKKWYFIGGSAVLASVLFFLLTNFAVWAFSPWYAKTLAGLGQCYLMAIPFFRNTLAGDLFYTLAFFGTYSLVEFWVTKNITARLRRAVKPSTNLLAN